MLVVPEGYKEATAYHAALQDLTIEFREFKASINK